MNNQRYAVVISSYVQSGKNVAYAVPVPPFQEEARPPVSCFPPVLEYVFRQTNRVDGTEFISQQGIPLPSTSIGDVVILDGRYFVCDGVGWKELTVLQAIRQQQAGGWR